MAGYVVATQCIMHISHFMTSIGQYKVCHQYRETAENTYRQLSNTKLFCVYSLEGGREILKIF